MNIVHTYVDERLEKQTGSPQIPRQRWRDGGVEEGKGNSPPRVDQGEQSRQTDAYAEHSEERGEAALLWQILRELHNSGQE